MSKRVHEIARERNLDTKEVIGRLNEAGVQVKHHSESVEDPVYESVFGDETDAQKKSKGNGADPEKNGKVKPVLKADDCQQQLPAWGVTREFRFGQFIRLVDVRSVNGQRQVTPIVLNADGDVMESEPAADTKLTSTSDVAPSPGMPLQALEAKNVDEALAGSPEKTISVPQVEQLVRDGFVEIGAKKAAVTLGPDSVAALRSGRSITAVVHPDGDKPEVVRLAPRVKEKTINRTDLDDVLANREVDAGPDGKVRLDDTAMQALIRDGEVTAAGWQDGQARDLVRVSFDDSGDRPPARPAWRNLLIGDLADFLAAPVIPAVDGQTLVVPLGKEDVENLRLGEFVWVDVRDTPVQFILRWALFTRTASGEVILEGPEFVELGPAYVRDSKYTRYDLEHVHRELKSSTMPVSTESQEGDVAVSPQQAPQLSLTGLPVAILLPWKQTWALVGYTRGNLLSSLALAPGEETRITITSWERRAKALQQTAETEVEQTFDFSSTTRDTEDVFSEMVNSNEFSTQAHGELDASYTMAMGSIQVGAGGAVENTGSLQTTARFSTQQVRETTNRASTRVRSRRITTISESVEQTSTNEVVRTIRNPNACRTLTMNFHEALAHYDVSIRFNRPAVRVVVLVPNPCPITKFDEMTARVHEASLQAGLLDAALVDGFEACRLLSAYEYAEDELRRLANMAKQELDLDRQPEVPPPSDPQKPENPHLAPLLALLRDLKASYTPFPTSEVMPALKTIAGWKIPNETEVASANRWLWKRLVATKFGTGLLAALGDLQGVTEANLGPDYARRVVSATPAQGTFPSLDGLGSLSDKEKEDAGLYSVTSSNYSAGWWWWYPRLKDYRLYDVDDAGIPGKLAQLRTTLQTWETKEAEGEGMEKAEAVIARAEAEQQKVTLADRLEMKFGAETVGAAFERREALLAHLNEHRDYYRYVLFQAMPPSEQIQRLMETAPQLRVGMFEPRVVASDGPNLAIPLTPLAESELEKLVNNLSDVLEEAAQQAEAAGNRIAVDRVILTTPGISVESWLGECSGCEDHLEGMREAELRQEVAAARQAELEGDRLEARIKDDQLDDPSPEHPLPIHVTVDESTP